ncbi:hypothetical protein CHCC5022_4192 [Bacillus paralicheniformis]|nr:hypothetical protein B4094_1874 [Bacillus licheniformis]TWJ57723.1 hypothetical protein CHCC5022_4192 [Bacillus paralicheniformis]TWJ82183.1 hypothetical protein CHCC4186_1844 [Bacillus paralicheniformis]TWK49242.1 hypothetical protein CHCC20347_1525 [Bacillus paralicheniformis]
MPPSYSTRNHLSAFLFGQKVNILGYKKGDKKGDYLFLIYR